MSSAGPPILYTFTKCPLLSSRTGIGKDYICTLPSILTIWELYIYIYILEKKKRMILIATSLVVRLYDWMYICIKDVDHINQLVGVACAYPPPSKKKCGFSFYKIRIDSAHSKSHDSIHRLRNVLTAISARLMPLAI